MARKEIMEHDWLVSKGLTAKDFEDRLKRVRKKVQKRKLKALTHFQEPPCFDKMTMPEGETSIRKDKRRELRLYEVYSDLYSTVRDKQKEFNSLSDKKLLKTISKNIDSACDDMRLVYENLVNDSREYPVNYSAEYDYSTQMIKAMEHLLIAVIADCETRIRED